MKGLVITDPFKKGTEKQCIALANALGIVHIPVLYPQLKWGGVLGFLHSKWAYTKNTLQACSEFLKNAPQVIIVAGRRSARLGAYLHHLGHFVIFLQKPPIACKNFNSVLIPQHDVQQFNNLPPNCLATLGALHHITPGFLQQQQQQFSKKHPDLYQKLIPQTAKKAAVLIGGNNKIYKITARHVQQWCRDIQKLADQGWGFMITVSRRTPVKIADLLHQALQHPHIIIWSGQGPNPYEVFLSHADAVLVTSDSISMLCESAGTGKPIYGLELARKTGKQYWRNKFDAFVGYLREKGMYHAFQGNLDTSLTYPPLNPLPMYAKYILDLYERMGKKQINA